MSALLENTPAQRWTGRLETQKEEHLFPNIFIYLFIYLSLLKWFVDIK